MAGSEKDSIKDLFGSKLKNHEVDVPDAVWANIEQGLSAHPSTSARRVTLRRITAFAAAIIGLIVVSGVLLRLSKPEMEANKLSNNFDNNLQYSLQRELNTANNTLATSGETILHQLSKSINETAYNKRSLNLSSAMHDRIGEPDIILCTVADTDMNMSIALKNKSQVAQSNMQRRASTPIILPSRTKGRQYDDMAFNLTAGSGLLSTSNDQRGGLMPFSSKSHPEMAKEPTFRDNVIDLKHNQPISFGLTVSKRLTNRLSVETGLTYTYLSSTFKTVNSDAVDEKIAFHYMGVPLYLNYTFAQWGKANFHVSAGAKIEKDIQGRYNSTLVNTDIIDASINNPIESKSAQCDKGTDISRSLTTPTYTSSHVKKNIHQNHIQMSAHLSVGASYPIYNKLEVYARIGGAYYFDADNMYPTIYSDKKTQLDLNFGLRMNF